MSTQPQQEPTSLRLERILPATPQTVFRSWTMPELMAGWLSPAGRAEVSADVRVGGRFSLVMVGDERRIDHEGEYLEVQPPHRLVFTWRSAYTDDLPSVVTVLLEAMGESTRLVLTHEQLPAHSVASHAGGWGGILDRLAQSVLLAQSESR